jgi:hypothetical protein
MTSNGLHGECYNNSVVVHTIKDDVEGMQVIRDKKAGGMREKNYTLAAADPSLPLAPLAPALSTNPSLARHLSRSGFDTGFVRTAENTVPSSLMTWCCS